MAAGVSSDMFVMREPELKHEPFGKVSIVGHLGFKPEGVIL